MSSNTSSPNKCGNPDCTNPPNMEPMRRCSRCTAVWYCGQECQAASWPAHKTECKRPNYIIEFQICPGKIVNPPVKRTLSCPADAPFHDLHIALQIAFGWYTSHSYDFVVLDPTYSAPRGLVGFIQERQARDLNGGKTPASTSRRFLLRIDDRDGSEYMRGIGIDRMHVADRQHPRTVEKKADAVKLYQVFDNPKYQNHTMIYCYDFGDNWEHHLKFEGRAPPTRGFACLGGTGHPVAENAGSWSGWEEIKAAYRTDKPTKEQLERREMFEYSGAHAGENREGGLAGDRVHEWDRALVDRLIHPDVMPNFHDEMLTLGAQKVHELKMKHGLY